MAKEGVFCTPEWLLYEIGIGPEVRSDYKRLNKQVESTQTNTKIPPEKTRIIEELMVFKRLNKHAIDFVVEDDTMSPHYQPGDYVAGTIRSGDKIGSLVGYDCIVQTIDGRIAMRNLQRGPRSNSFNLISTNLHTKTKDAIIYDVELANAAPILWHRRNEPLI